MNRPSNRYRRLTLWVGAALLALGLTGMAAYYPGGVKAAVASIEHAYNADEGARRADRMAETASAGSAVERELIMARHDREAGRPIPGLHIPATYRLIALYPWALALAAAPLGWWVFSRRV